MPWQASPDYSHPIGSVERKLERQRAYYWRNRERLRSDAQREKERQWRAALTPERKAARLAANAEWKRLNHERDREARRAPHRKEARRLYRVRQAQLDPEKWRRQAKAIRLKTQYGVPIDRYDAMLEAQGGVCAVCRQPETLVIRNRVALLGIDHDHSCCPGKKSCGKCVRGLLCSQCNRIAGNAHDDPIRLRAIADYIDACRAVD